MLALLFVLTLLVWKMFGCLLSWLRLLTQLLRLRLLL
jgi:hypothetical protein